MSKPLTVEQVMTMLGQTPPCIADAVAHAATGRMRVNPTPDEWSAIEVLAHLRACADIWGGCIDAILAEDEPTIRAVNPRRWIQSTDYITQDFRDSLRAFTAQRVDLLVVLKPLVPGDWSRSATITGAGKPLDRTVFDYAQRLARHEQSHIKQIRRTVEAIRRSDPPARGARVALRNRWVDEPLRTPDAIKGPSVSNVSRLDV